MINRKNIRRAQRVVEKWEEGSTVNAELTQKQQFAKQKGYTYDPKTGLFSSPDPANSSRTIPFDKETSDRMFKAWSDEQAAQAKWEKIQTASGIISNVVDSADSMLAGFPNVTDQSTLTQGLNAGFDTATDLVAKTGPVGQVVSTALKVGGFASDALTAAGITTDQLTTADKVVDSKIISGIPVLGTALKLTNDLGAKKTDDFSIDNSTVAAVGGSYGGTVSELEDAEEIAGKKVGLFSSGKRKRMNKTIAKARQKQNDMAAIAKEVSDQTELVNAMGDQAANAYAFANTGGYKQQYMKVAQGGKAPEISKFAPEIIGLDIPKEDIIKPSSFKDGGLINEKINPTTGTIEEVQQEWVPDIIDLETFKSGGKIEKQLDAPEIEETNQKNIIPEGALHKNKHNMENAEDLTKKGIPVVDDNHEQQAEIEKNEIIFTKEVTQKLEELYKVYYSEDSTQKEKDEAAIDAGKLLTKEIMLNTDDRTGLIDSLQKGGNISKKNNSKGRTLEELVTYAEKVNPRFVQRLNEFPGFCVFEPDQWGGKAHGTHAMAWEYLDPDESVVMVFPTIMEDENGDLKYYGKRAMDVATQRKDYLIMSPEEAKTWTEHYKEHYNKYVDDFDLMEQIYNANPFLSQKEIRDKAMKLRNVSPKTE